MTKPKNQIRYGVTVYKLKRTSYGEPWEVQDYVVTSRRPRRSWFRRSDGSVPMVVDIKRRLDAPKWSGRAVEPSNLFTTRAAALRAAAEKDRALAAKLLACADAATAEAARLEANSEGHGG